MTTITVRHLEASRSASCGAISYIELARLSAYSAFYGCIAYGMCKIAKRLAKITLNAVKNAPENEVIDPSGEFTARIEGVASSSYELYSSIYSNQDLRKGSFFDRLIAKELIALNHLHNEVLVCINEHNADASGLSHDGPYESADDFISSLS